MAAVLAAACDIVEAMVYLHEHNIIHGDLKPSNILLKTLVVEGTPTVQAKVADFGTAIVLQDSQTSKRYFGGTPTHMAPEVVKSSTVCRASDVYSFGILLYELSTGQKPYSGLSPEHIISGVKHNDLRPTIPDTLPRPLIRLITQCWQQDSDARPTFPDIRSMLHSLTTQLPGGRTHWVAWGPAKAGPKRSATANDLDNTASQTGIHPHTTSRGRILRRSQSEYWAKDERARGPTLDSTAEEQHMAQSLEDQPDNGNPELSSPGRRKKLFVKRMPCMGMSKARKAEEERGAVASASPQGPFAPFVRLVRSLNRDKSFTSGPPQGEPSYTLHRSSAGGDVLPRYPPRKATEPAAPPGPEAASPALPASDFKPHDGGKPVLGFPGFEDLQMRPESLHTTTRPSLLKLDENEKMIFFEDSAPGAEPSPAAAVDRQVAFVKPAAELAAPGDSDGVLALLRQNSQPLATTYGSEQQKRLQYRESCSSLGFKLSKVQWPASSLGSQGSSNSDSLDRSKAAVHSDDRSRGGQMLLHRTATAGATSQLRSSTVAIDRRFNITPSMMSEPQQGPDDAPLSEYPKLSSWVRTNMSEDDITRRSTDDRGCVSTPQVGSTSVSTGKLSVGGQQSPGSTINLSRFASGKSVSGGQPQDQPRGSAEVGNNNAVAVGGAVTSPGGAPASREMSVSPRGTTADYDSTVSSESDSDSCILIVQSRPGAKLSIGNVELP